MKAYITKLSSINPEKELGCSVTLSEVNIQADKVVDDPDSLPNEYDKEFWDIVDDNVVVVFNEDHHKWAMDYIVNPLYREKLLEIKSILEDVELSSGTYTLNFTEESLADFYDKRHLIKISGTPISWKVYDNSYVDLTEDDFDTVFVAIETKKGDAFAAYQADKLEVYNSNNFGTPNLNSL